ncbi:hypothetical protein MLD38_002162 [Melastoma candidum]|uniref:Uncharacterized protein n=1 Tax=Melastoma candidum TaxID=119954 RepID=A0ACB9SKH3_9MYRT|nr:hypothetical protein MLD38_002162 [Melastoma candidum]
MVAGSEAEEDLRAFREAVSLVPWHVAKDLISREVCLHCIIRLFGIREPAKGFTSLSPSMFSDIVAELPSTGEGLNGIELGENKDKNDDETNEERHPAPSICSVCFGILQICKVNDAEIPFEKNGVNFLANVIADAVKEEGHEFDSFCVEVSTPPAIPENDLSLLSYINSKYGSESWLQKKPLGNIISLKEALKALVTGPLETKLGVNCSQGTFRIWLTYKEASPLTSCDDKTPVAKRQKTDCNNKNTLVACTTYGLVAENEATEPCVDSGKITMTIPTDGFGNGIAYHESSCLSKSREPCSLSIECYRDAVYFGGRYLKYSRNVSQTCWMIDEERMGVTSVEEIISGCILPFCRGDKSKFHAAGREDIDVRMLGSGRPFLVEIQNARHVPSIMDIKGIEEKINESKSKLVRVKHLKLLGSEAWSLMREGEAEKQKQYAAVVWISRPLEDRDLCTLSSFKDLSIMQKTPIRVLHRRSPLEREKIIHWMKIERISGSSQYFVLHLCTQAGTYIKEFVHGDLGRTNPSIGSILGCRAEILQLDVTDVKMDLF